MIGKGDFGEDFQWGVATAAYQIEGAYNSEGKGLSIWDVFANTPGKISGNLNGNKACDYYHQFRKDLILMRQLHIPNYRFSISWSRLLPDGTGRKNYRGIDYYNRVIDFCLELEITPWITIYHWDLPQMLEKKGGWTNRDIIAWFSEYVSCCMTHFSDRAKHWMVLNEPMAFTGAGYFLGIHAPGRRGLFPFLAAVHHAALCQAEGGRIVRAEGRDCKVGTTFSYSYIEPLSQIKAKDFEAAHKINALLNRTFLEPLLGLSYPTEDLAILNRMEKFVHQHDETKLAFDMDFIGVQNYTREVVKHSPFTPYIGAAIVNPLKRNAPSTMMDWEIYPESIYQALKKYAAYENMPELMVTENGIALADEVVDGAVQDEFRIIYLKNYLKQVLRAKKEGVNVRGYFIWSFLDNFEWAKGYGPRFGLVHVDFESQKRIVKSSAYWYSKFLQNVQRIVTSSAD